jgi:primosomal protein N' (replication factor Y)
MTCADNFIEVAVPLPVEGLYTYRVPDALSDKIQIGRRVLAPFGKKIRAGFIISRSDVAPSDLTIKDIVNIPDEPPYFTRLLWEFILWVAHYYMAPVGAVLKTALPPGSDRKSVAWTTLTEEGRNWVLENKDITFPARLLKSGAVPRKLIDTAIGSKLVDEAIRKKWLSVEQRIANPRKARVGLLGVFEASRLAAREKEAPPQLTPQQADVAQEIAESLRTGLYTPHLLYGVTGSGKTEVYLDAIEKALALGKRVLVLVPEIALTPQLARRFVSRLGEAVGIFHSGYTGAQRLLEWRQIMSGAMKVVIAARSGIFLPMDDLGLIIVDEEHDPSYKQSDGCTYNARDMAIARAKLQGATVVLGSATPSFESFVNCQKGKIKRLDLRSRHHGGGLPKVELVDLKASKISKKSLLTPMLIEAIEEALSKKEQVLIFLNRRGFDTFAMCRSCGFVFKCPNCDISLTHHKRAKDLRCHMCGYARVAPPLCPQCSSEKIFFGGIGTQKIEEELSALFPAARIERLDADSTRKRENLEGILDRFRKKEIDILTGTQMLVKGHDFPGISLVGVLCGDASLHFPDFRAGERTFQMLTQVAGRTGRESDSGKVIIQTFDPFHDAIQCAAEHAFERFFQLDSTLREELSYPPFGHLILIRIEGNSEKRVEAKAVKIARAARILKEAAQDILILGPAPAPIKKKVGKYRWQVLLKSRSRASVRNVIAQLRAEGHLKGQGVRTAVDIDPIDLM